MAIHCNRSLCHSRLFELDEALLDAIAAIVCDPTSLKAHYRRASVLVAMEKPRLAEAAVACGLRVDPTNKDLQEIQKKVWAAINPTTKLAGAQFSKEDLYVRNRLKKFVDNAAPEMPENPYAAMDDLPMMTRMSSTFESKSSDERLVLGDKPCKVADVFDGRVENFPKEFFQSNNIPIGCDAARSRKRLTMAYEKARLSKLLFWRVMHEFREIRELKSFWHKSLKDTVSHS